MNEKKIVPLYCPAEELVGYMPAGTEVEEEYMAWEAGLFLRRCLTPALPEAERVAGSAEHELVLYLGEHACELQRETGGRWERGRLTSGAVNFNPAGEPQSWRWDRPTDWLMLYLRDDLLRQAAAGLVDADPAKLELIPRFLIRDGVFAELALALQIELRDGSRASRLYVETAAQMLAVHLLRRHCAMNYRIKEYRGGIPAGQLRRVLDYMHAYLHRDISLAQLASQINMTQYHFARQFKRTLGEAPYQHLMRLRIERAQQLLRDTELPIAVIAARVGYRSQSRFAALFKRLVGTTPQRYRRQH